MWETLKSYGVVIVIAVIKQILYKVRILDILYGS